MKCPRCPQADLVMGERKGIEIDYCSQCRGIWLDAGELDKIIERSGHYASQPDSGQSRGRQDDNESWWERIIDIFD